MKIAILTQPLGHNYGGLLQAYALQTYLKSLGHEVVTIDRRKSNQSFLPSLKHYVRQRINFLKGRIQSIPSAKRDKFTYQELHGFRDSYVSLTSQMQTTEKMREHFEKSRYDLVVVGSDQVWRPKYSPCLENFFLDFLHDINVRKISYSASFGVDDWEFDASQTERCQKLIRQFDGVSVRELSAVSLCQSYLKVLPQWVVDPTLLLDPIEYERFISDKDEIGARGKVLSYVLDPAEEKQLIAYRVAEEIGTSTFFIKPQQDYTQVKAKDIESCKYPKVEHWLQSFHDAEFVVTDSFHGCVFAILFNKPFIAVGNVNRGLARFKSLLSSFNLEERLVLSFDELTSDLILKKVDWEKVNRKRKELASVGQLYLQQHLKE